MKPFELLCGSVSEARGWEGGDIYLRSVLSAHRNQIATPVCDNHSWKMKSAVRQANSINTYSGMKHSMDTDVKTLIQMAIFLLFFCHGLKTFKRKKASPWGNKL